MDTYFSKQKWYSLIAKVLTGSFIIGITVYTFVLFIDRPIIDLLTTYFIPSYVLLLLFGIVLKNEKLGALLLILCSFGFLLIYHFTISLVVFCTVLVIGFIFLIDSNIKESKHKL